MWLWCSRHPFNLRSRGVVLVSAGEAPKLPNGCTLSLVLTSDRLLLKNVVQLCQFRSPMHDALACTLPYDARAHTHTRTLSLSLSLSLSLINQKTERLEYRK